MALTGSPFALAVGFLPAAVVGSLIDSIFGATLQRLYHCEHCQTTTERMLHIYGHPTRPLRGVPWMTNDLINFIATCADAITAILVSQPLLSP